MNSLDSALFKTNLEFPNTLFPDLTYLLKNHPEIPEIHEALAAFKKMHTNYSKIEPEDIFEFIFVLIRDMKLAQNAQNSLDNFILIFDLSDLYSYYTGIIEYFIKLYERRNDTIKNILDDSMYPDEDRIKKGLAVLKDEGLIRTIKLEIARVGNSENFTGIDDRYIRGILPNFERDLPGFIKNVEKNILGNTSVEITKDDEDNEEVVITIEDVCAFVNDLYNTQDHNSILALILKHPGLIRLVDKSWRVKDAGNNVELIRNVLMYCSKNGCITACMILMMCGADPTIKVKPDEEYKNHETPQEYFAGVKPGYLGTTTLYKMTQRSYEILKKGGKNVKDQLKNDYNTFKKMMEKDERSLISGYGSHIIDWHNVFGNMDDEE